MLEDISLDDSWSIEGSLDRDIKMEQADECEAILRRPHVDSCSYVERETANWSLQRIRGPCDAYVSKFKGDVKVNGQSTSGIVNLSKGDVIQTGDQSKVHVTFGIGQSCRIGSNAEFKVVDPCEAFSPTGKKVIVRIIGGKLQAMIDNLVGVERGFEIRTGFGGAGGREARGIAGQARAGQLRSGDSVNGRAPS